MEIKEFIKESLLQIVDGINEANDELHEKGAYIPSEKLVGDGVLFTVDKNNETHNFIKVDFDVAVTVSQSDSSKIGGGISIASFINAGCSAEDVAASQSVSRIKYMIPLALPENLKK